jgi:protoporphyrinogen oxidase
MQSEFLIVGGGPTGLGAASYLQEQSRDWYLLEADDHFGGLASSFVDEQGFTWDMGGHVHFSHYDTFDRYMALAIPPDGWLQHRRESWIRMRGRFVPYPLQNNVHRLPEADCAACLAGLKQANERRAIAPPANFAEWMEATFGEGLTRLFMRPYNVKVWAYPPDRLGWNWIGERVAVPSYEKIMAAIRANRDDDQWGPNRCFTFPKHGGTGSIWNALGRRLPAERIALNCRVQSIDAARRVARTADGRTCSYRRLISTLPLDDLIRVVPGVVDAAQAERLVHSSVHTVGVGIDGTPPDSLKTKCWMYFPESNSPYYRVTVFSNYSPFNTPQPERQWSLMAEVSQSQVKTVAVDRLVDDVLRAMVEDELLPDRIRVCSIATRFLPHAYPTPFVDRDRVVDPILRRFEAADILSRGRFGAWKYEVGNEDHSFAQGYECARRLIENAGPEAEPTLFTPGLVNSRRNP